MKKQIFISEILYGLLLTGGYSKSKFEELITKDYLNYLALCRDDEGFLVSSKIVYAFINDEITLNQFLLIVAAMSFNSYLMKNIKKLLYDSVEELYENDVKRIKEILDIEIRTYNDTVVYMPK